MQNCLKSYSRDGIIQQQGMASIYDMLKTLDPEIQGAKVDLATTFDDRFVRRAGT